MASARPASEGSGRQQESRDGQSRFVIPPAIDNFDDVPSPSQHRLSFASQRRQAGLDSISDDQDQDDGIYSEEEEEEDVEAQFSHCINCMSLHLLVQNCVITRNVVSVP